uniref:Uncharacterized protein n=2 Tax=Parascaris univalens TaxID=6257 RepID=A0A915BLZ3_PARUN
HRRQVTVEMCSGRTWRMLYIISVFIMFVLTATALFTPGWRKFSRRSDGKVRFPKSSGLFSFLCASSKNAAGGVDYCKEWFKLSEPWEQAVVLCVCVALAIELITLVWSIITVVCSPLETRGASAVLPFLTFLATILVMFAATLYTVKKDIKTGIHPLTSILSIIRECYFPSSKHHLPPKQLGINVLKFSEEVSCGYETSCYIH